MEPTRNVGHQICGYIIGGAKSLVVGGSKKLINMANSVINVNPKHRIFVWSSTLMAALLASETYETHVFKDNIEDDPVSRFKYAISIIAAVGMFVGSQVSYAYHMADLADRTVMDEHGRQLDIEYLPKGARAFDFSGRLIPRETFQYLLAKYGITNPELIDVIKNAFNEAVSEKLITPNELEEQSPEIIKGIVSLAVYSMIEKGIPISNYPADKIADLRQKIDALKTEFGPGLKKALLDQEKDEKLVDNFLGTLKLDKNKIAATGVLKEIQQIAISLLIKDPQFKEALRKASEK